MRIKQLIVELEELLKKEGNIEVTCTASSLNESLETTCLPDVWESTVENLIVRASDDVFGEKRVRLYL